jgi:hypothetical protein
MARTPTVTTSRAPEWRAHLAALFPDSADERTAVVNETIDRLTREGRERKPIEVALAHGVWLWRCDREVSLDNGSVRRNLNTAGRLRDSVVRTLIEAETYYGDSRYEPTLETDPARLAEPCGADNPHVKALRAMLRELNPAANVRDFQARLPGFVHQPPNEVGRTKGRRASPGHPWSYRTETHALLEAAGVVKKDRKELLEALFAGDDCNKALAAEMGKKGQATDVTPTAAQYRRYIMAGLTDHDHVATCPHCQRQGALRPDPYTSE